MKAKRSEALYIISDVESVLNLSVLTTYPLLNLVLLWFKNKNDSIQKRKTE